MPKTTFYDIAYPGKLWDEIKQGKPVDFQKLVSTGMVVSCFTFDYNAMLEILNGVKTWADSVNSQIAHVVYFDEEQKKLDRFIEITKNNGFMDKQGLNELFASVCLCSQLSEHNDEDKPILISADTLEVTFGSSSMKGYYIAISSIPDLIEDERLKQFADVSINKLKNNLKKSKKERELAESQMFEKSITYNISVGHMVNSNIQQGTVDSILNQTIQQNDLKQINDLISKLESIIEKLNMSESQKSDVLAHIETIKIQTKSPKPKRQIVIETLGSLSDALKAIPASQVIVTEIVSNIGHILKSLGFV